jgi:hypothetical protein
VRPSKSLRLAAFTFAALGATLLASPAGAQSTANDGATAVTTSSPRPVTRAGTRTGDIRIDGRIDDPAWASAPVTRGFVQSEPGEGTAASRDTEARIVFDDDALYVSARMWDHPDSIQKQLLRRDERTPSMDWFGFSIDPEADGRTGYEFRVNAAGVQQDIYVSDDAQEDQAWNAVWESAVAYDSLGWTVEARLPLSQIRYEASDGPQTWGLNLHRRRAIVAELSHFSLESRRISGIVSQFGIMAEVRVPGSVRRMEARPYLLSSFHNGPAEIGDPFFDGNDAGARVGSDFRVGLGSAFTLDATVNPDFGQVDADPAVINLSAFETRFDERRPFFVEDAQVFDFNLSGGQNQLYYSRRIGRSPHGSGPSDADFTDVPQAATILGAAKLTGRTSGGMSLGGLAAVTRAESGEAYFNSQPSPSGDRFEAFRAEPRTEFGVLTARQDFRDGLSQVGAIGTALRRDLPAGGEFDDLPDQAYNLGARFDTQWDDRKWKLAGFVAGSRVQGSPEALVAVQRSSVHYFQRPDATRARVDSSATSMMGAEWRLQLDRQNTEHWSGSLWHAGVTKGFEVNDLGFSTNRERLDGGAGLGYRELTPGSVLRNFNVGLRTVYNFSWEALDDASSWDSWRRAYTNGNFTLNGGVTFLGYKSLNGNLSFQPDLYSRTATRGGPVMIQPGNLNLQIGGSTDRRRPTSFSTGFRYTRANRNGGDDWAVDANVSLRPNSRVQVEIQPEFEIQKDAAQYVANTGTLSYQPTFGRRYLFGELEQKSVSLEVRANYTFSPALSVQLFAQPLLSSGDYVAYKQLLGPDGYDFRTFTEGSAVLLSGRVFCSGGAICRDASGNQRVDFDGDAVPDYTFEDQDFNVRSLVGNAVLRWEYRPGSTIFLVWQRQQDEEVGTGDFRFGRDLDALWRTPAHNRFLVKVNYWLGL